MSAKSRKINEDLIPVSQLGTLPLEPGVYRFYDKDHDLLYIGKALYLKKRVKQYFQRKHEDFKTQVLVKKIAFIAIIVLRSESEALKVEKQLIQDHKPRYNILLKDDKHFPYLKITNEAFPRLLIVRKKDKDNADYFGPYPSIGSSKSLLRHLHRLFPIRDCKQAISLHKKEPKCILLDLGRCIGPCIYKDCKLEYDDYIASLKLFLQGKKQHLLTHVQEKMKNASQRQDYEAAKVYRDAFLQLSQLKEQGKENKNLLEDCLCFAVAYEEKRYYSTLQVYKNGKLSLQMGLCETQIQNKYSFFEQSFLQSIQSIEDKSILLLCEPEIANMIVKLSEGTTQAFKIQSPQRGEKRQLLNLAQLNAKQGLQRMAPKKEHKESLLIAAKKKLKLEKLPKRIFGFDISHLQGSGIVGSAVCFTEGKANKAFYRHFIIKEMLEHSHDPLCMQEVVLRRLKMCDEADPYPDLILIDGGKGQLSFSFKALQMLNLEKKIAILSLAKKEERLFSPYDKQGVCLEKRDPILQLLQQVRDESHRFALRLQRKQRYKDFFKES